MECFRINGGIPCLKLLPICNFQVDPFWLVFFLREAVFRAAQSISVLDFKETYFGIVFTLRQSSNLKCKTFVRRTVIQIRRSFGKHYTRKFVSSSWEFQQHSKNNHNKYSNFNPKMYVQYNFKKYYLIVEGILTQILYLTKLHTFLQWRKCELQLLQSAILHGLASGLYKMQHDNPV